MAEVRPIDANALIEELRKHKGQFPADGNEPFMCWEVEGYINDQETLTQTIELHAKWEDCNYAGGKWYCSNCEGVAYLSIKSPYCPHCGAKMKEGAGND